jgi:putative ABC transport system permease protein
MLKRYFQIACRHIARRKLFSFINIFGLAIGIAFSMLIAVYVLQQRDVNGDLKTLSQQYLIGSKWDVESMGLPMVTMAPLAKTLRDEYPTLVANYYRHFPFTALITVGDKHFREEMQAGDSSLVSMFGFPLLYGNPAAAFKDDNAILITESQAIKCFGRKDVLDQIISIETRTIGKKDYVISGVLKDLPTNSVTGVNGSNSTIFLTMRNIDLFGGKDSDKNWGNWYMMSFVQLQKGMVAADLEKPIAQLMATHAPDDAKKHLKTSLSGLSQYYLDENNGLIRKMTYTLSCIAAFILLMAVINFVNISIGTATYRLKEIGLRKTFGGTRNQLILQHLSEAVVLTLMATLIALGLYELSLPVFNNILNTKLVHIWELSIEGFGFMTLLVLTVGFMAGFYPAFVLTTANMLHSLKGKMEVAKGALLLRKSSLVVQFVIAIFVFICTLYVSKQLDFFFSKELGFNKDQLLVISSVPRKWDADGVEKMLRVRDVLAQVPYVKEVSLSYEVPNGNNSNNIGFYPEGGDADNPINMGTLTADEHYAATYGLTVKEGNFFSTQFVPGEIVINEAAMKALGWASAVGKKLYMKGNPMPAVVTGVVKDFHFASMHESIKPFYFVHVKGNIIHRFLSIKLDGKNYNKAIVAISSKWNELEPDAPFDYFFMDTKFQSLYNAEVQLKKAANVATILNFVIILLGAVGVVSFSLTKRTKEIAVRKVLGANTRGIIALFLKEYTAVIFIANIIAWPLAYLLVNQWLNDYAYKTNMSILPFLFVGGFTFMVAYVLITLQCFKVAVANPTNLLRSE